MVTRCTHNCPQAHFPLHWVSVPGQVVFCVVVLCVVLLLMQRAALKNRGTDE